MPRTLQQRAIFSSSGTLKGGVLCFENGTVLSQRDVWHSFNGRAVTHWNNEILPVDGSDEPPLKYAIVAYSHEGNSIMRRRPRPTRWARALKALRRVLVFAQLVCKRRLYKWPCEERP